jgi:hypothetical protein
MMRRVVADKDGGIIAVTLMSSDTGKLYAAFAQVVDKAPLGQPLNCRSRGRRL